VDVVPAQPVFGIIGSVRFLAGKVVQICPRWSDFGSVLVRFLIVIRERELVGSVYGSPVYRLVKAEVLACRDPTHALPFEEVCVFLRSRTLCLIALGGRNDKSVSTLDC
jgi:hypothetical protein